MTGGLTWYQWLATAAAAIAVAGWVWAKLLRPTLRAIRRFSELLDRLFQVLEAWPEVQAAVIAHAGELTTLAFQVGELKGQTEKDAQALRRDVNELWKRYRHTQGEPLPSSREGGTGG